MKHEIEGNDLRDCIDKAFDAGYNEAVRLAGLWLDLNLHTDQIPEFDMSDFDLWLNSFNEYMEINKCE